MNLVINELNCLSVKKKGSKLQCPHKRKHNSNLCGVHQRAKNVVYITQYLEENVENVENIEKNKNVEDIEIIVNSNKNEHYDKEFLMNLFKMENPIDPFNLNLRDKDNGLNVKSIHKLKVGKLRNTIKFYNLLSVVDKNQSKRNLFRLLVNYFYWERNYDIKKIIHIQNYVRRFNILKRKNTVNDTDCILMINKYEIPLQYYFTLYDDTSEKSYSFDVRSLNDIINNNKHPTNPYTLSKINQDMMSKIIKRIEYLLDKGLNISFEEENISEEQKLEFRVIKIFQEINLFGNYTDFNWFMNLKTYELKNLYIKTEDMVNYRINLPQIERVKYFNKGISFPLNSSKIHTITCQKKIQELILYEYEEIIKYDNDINDKKTAIMWLLIALTEVSNDARNALPLLNINIED